MDTTYFWRDFWVMVYRSSSLKENIHYKQVVRENKQEYIDWIRHLLSEWRKIEAIVCDGKPWLFKAFWDIPVQMCVFHQKQIIRRYITKNPILEANQELNALVSMLWNITKREIESWLVNWHKRHKEFIEQISVNPVTWKRSYTHSRTRSAYRSLLRNLKYLYTYEDYQWKIDIPKTTNGLEWIFGHLKDKVRLHRWLRKDRKLKLIFELLS